LNGKVVLNAAQIQRLSKLASPNFTFEITNRGAQCIEVQYIRMEVGGRLVAMHSLPLVLTAAGEELSYLE
jgi:hypothetical protein